MARSLEGWTDDWHKKLQKVHGNIDRAKAEEGVRAVRENQKTAPKGKWKRRGSQKGRGYKILHNSIKLDFQTGETYTDHPGAKKLNVGGLIRPKNKRWLSIPLKGSWTPGKSGFMAIRTSSGNLAIVHQKRPMSGIAGLFLRQVNIPRSRWIDIAHAATTVGGDERIADKVIDTRGA